MTSELTADELEYLDRLIAQVLSGDSSIEDSLAEVTIHRDEFESILRTALLAHSYGAPDRPTESFSRNSKARILNQLAANRPVTPFRAKRLRRIFLRPAFGLLGLVLAIGLSFSMVVNASASSLPGDSLYGVKRGLEAARLALTIRPAGDARLLLEYMDHRLDEASAGLGMNRETDAMTALEGYQESLDHLLTLTTGADIGSNDQLFVEIELGLEGQHQKLLQVLENAPDAAKPGLENALDRSSHGKEVIEQIHQGGSPSDLAPGQLKKTEQPDNLPGGGGSAQDKPKKEKERVNPQNSPGNGDN